jgi:membrane protease YdiL (CAAX protease family)
MATISLPGSGSRSHTLRLLAETGLGYALILITIWSPRSIRNYFALAAALVIFTSLLLSGYPRATHDSELRSGLVSLLRLGFRSLELRPLLQCSWAVALSLALAVSAIALAAHLGTLHFDSNLMSQRPPLVGYMVWSLIQQVILQYFLMQRLLLLLRKPWMAIAMAALLFSAAHVPNPLLVPATLLWGIAACWLYLRYRSLIAVAIIHFLLGACLAICVPAYVHRNMRVGLGYIRYHSHRAQTLPAPNGLKPGLDFESIPR